METVTPGLTIYDVEIDDEKVVVDLYGGSTNAFGCVMFKCDDPEVRLATFSAVNDWKLQNLPVHLVDGPEFISLRLDK